jgi:hypothetical protein
MFLDTVELRIVVALGLRLIATEIVPAQEAALRDYLRKLAVSGTRALDARGLRAEPGFPGRTLARRSSGVARTLFAAEVWQGEEHVGTAFTSVIAGRLPSISVAPPASTDAQPRAPHG